MTELVHTDLLNRLFTGDGEMARLMRSHDWSQTPLGPVDTWPQSLRTTVSILLNSRYPMFVWWGPQYANLYNDAYRPILGASKHPHFLGQSAKDCWAEIWDVIGERIARVVTAGEPTWAENFQFLIDRYGYIEETYFRAPRLIQILLRIATVEQRFQLLFVCNKAIFRSALYLFL
jgi:hypothetical protein